MIESGKYYWVRSKVEMVWRAAYCGEDCDENLWLSICGIRDEWEVSTMDLSLFDFIEIDKPKN